jgi:hypothetical protein
VSEDRKPKPGDPCPRCSHPTERMEAMFYFRGRTWPGVFCMRCRAGWEDPEDQFIAGTIAASQADLMGD